MVSDATTRCECPQAHTPDGVHCRWLVATTTMVTASNGTTSAPVLCWRCERGLHHLQPSQPTGRWPEQEPASAF